MRFKMKEVDEDHRLDKDHRNSSCAYGATLVEFLI